MKAPQVGPATYAVSSEVGLGGLLFDVEEVNVELDGQHPVADIAADLVPRPERGLDGSRGAAGRAARLRLTKRRPSGAMTTRIPLSRRARSEGRGSQEERLNISL